MLYAMVYILYAYSIAHASCTQYEQRVATLLTWWVGWGTIGQLKQVWE